MPDVGNLNIEITSNASEASRGLYNVADALSRIKAAIPNNGLGLSTVAKELNAFAKQINQAKATNAVLQNIANFGKGLKDVTSAIKATSKDFDTSKITGAIDAIKASVGDGIKLGQSGTQLKNLKDALGGDWNTEKAQQAGEALKFIAEGAKSLTGTNLGTIAKNVSAVAKALDEYATASEHMISAVGGNKKSMTDVWETVEGASKSGKSRLPVNLQFHGWRDEMSGIASVANEVKNTSSSFDNLREVADILKDFRITKTKGVNIESLAQALDHLKRVTVGGIPLTAMINSIGRLNEKAGEIKSNGTVDILHELAEALRMVKESAEGMQTPNIKINFGGGRGSRKSSGDVAGVENVMQQSAREVDATFTDVQSTVRSIAEDIGNINTSLIEMNNVGGNNAEQMERMARAFAYMFEMASKMRSAMSLPEHGFIFGEGSVSEESGIGRIATDIPRITDETMDLILYNENLDNSWESIAGKIEAAKRELDGYFASQKEVVFGNESIKGIYEDKRFGPTLAGFYGKNAQANMIGQISKGTGLSVENITNQLYELSNGTINLKEALEKTASSNVTSGMEAVGKAISDVGTDSIDSASKLELLRQKLEIINRLKDRRVDALAARGMDPFNDKTVVDYMLKIIQLNEQIEKMVELNKQATMSNNGMEKLTESLGMKKGDLMAMKYQAMIEDAAKAYDAGKLTTQQFAETSMKIQEYGEKVVKAGGDIYSSATDAEKAVKQLMYTLNHPEGTDTSYFRDMVDAMTGVNRPHIPEEELKANSAFYTEYAQNVENLFNTLERPIDYSNYSGAVDQMLGIGRASGYTQEMVEKAFQQTTPAMRKVMTLSEKTAEATQRLSDALAGIAEGAKKGGNAIRSLFPTLNGLIKRFTSIAKMRAIRYIIRQISSGFSEGVQNVYQYSKAIGTAFAPAMDTAATALAQMKNTLGAAAAPIIQALIPVLQTVVNWFITAINYVNQFFALLNGQKTWTRALPKTVDAFDKQEKGAKKAGAAIKDLLADWDELNIIQSQGGGGGGAGADSTAEEYLEMFEEVGRFDNKVKDIVNFIKDNFETIKTIAEGIGAAILGWKLSSAFGKDLDTLKKLEIAAGLTLLITGLKISADAGYDIGRNGINGKSVGQAILGELLSMGGGALIGFALAGASGAVIGATVGMILSMVITQLGIKQGKLDSLYGDVSEDVDTIRANLENDLLTVDAKLDIQVYKAEVKNLGEARGKLAAALNALKDSYPVPVMITSDNKEEFRQKVNDLVEETNQATKENAELMKTVYVPATAQFSSTFIDDAWATIGKSVTNLGKQIGEELDKQITDNTKLDDLQRKLERLAEIMVDVTKTSEFSGAVSVSGAKVRANNFSNYNKDTVQAYMNEYNNLLDDTMGEAIGKAQTEYESITTLIEGLKESTTNGTLNGEDLVKAQEQLKTALDDYQKKFGIGYNPKVIPDLTKYAQTLFDKWTKAGSSLYEKDILGALSHAMENNKDYMGVRSLAFNQSTFADVTDDLIDKYLASNKSYLISTIAQESGMTEDSIKKFVENSGINPLEFFDKEYVKKYQENIMSWLINQHISQENKEKILESLGLGLSDYNTYVKQKLKEVDTDPSTKKSWFELSQEANQSILPDWATSGDSMQFVQTGEVPEMPVTPVIDEEDVIPNLSGQLKNALPDGGLPLEVNPYISTTWDGFTFDDSTLEGIYKHLNWQLADAGFEGGNRAGYQKIIESLKSAENIDTMNMLSDLIEEKGVVEAFKKLNELNLNPDGTFGNVANPARMRASNGTAVGIGTGGTGSTTEPQPVEIDFTGMTASVQKGSQEANRDVVDGLAAVVLGLQRLLGKEWSVNISPSTALGRTVGRSNSDLEAVTGYYNGGGN